MVLWPVYCASGFRIQVSRRMDAVLIRALKLTRLTSALCRKCELLSFVSSRQVITLAHVSTWYGCAVSAVDVGQQGLGRSLSPP